jgi:hypothetical protein
VTEKVEINAAARKNSFDDDDDVNFEEAVADSGHATVDQVCRSCDSILNDTFFGRGEGDIPVSNIHTLQIQLN